MKQLILTLAVSLLSISLWAQTVTLQFAGTNKHRNYQVIIDGTAYNSTEAVVSGKNKMMTMNNLSVGSHTIAVYRAGETITSANALFKDTFQLRSGYDLDIVVRPEGKVSFMERNNTQIAVSTGTYDAGMGMSSTDFNRLAQSVRSKLLQSARITALRKTFNTTSNYFTTEQIARLLSYISAEPTRLELAKVAYARVIDSANYRQLYDLFSNESLRSELDFFLRNTTITPGGTFNPGTDTTSVVDQGSLRVDDRSTGNSAPVSATDAQVKAKPIKPAERKVKNVSEKKEDVKEKRVTQESSNTVSYGSRRPVADRTFSQLMRKLRNQRAQLGKVSLVSNAFQNSGSYFTTDQVRQLLTPVSAEADRLTLAKLAYARTADTANFKSLYNLLNERYSQLELDHFIRFGSVGATVATASNIYAHRVAIDDANYARLDLKVRFHLQQPSTIAEIKKAFSGNQYFTVEQIRDWLTLVETEEDRLALAKLAYLRISDPTTFPALYNLFQSETSRSELEQYVSANKY